MKLLRLMEISLECGVDDACPILLDERAGENRCRSRVWLTGHLAATTAMARACQRLGETLRRY
jgi:hypothetical protein